MRGPTTRCNARARCRGHWNPASASPIGAIIAIELTPRSLGAGLGILAAVLTTGYIAFRLYEATTPVSTAFVLSSTSPAPMSVRSLRINDEEALPKGWTPADRTAGQAEPPQLQGNIALQVGRPVTVQATLSLPQGSAASCALEPLPYGACMLRVRFSAPGAMQCEYECKPQEPKP